MREKKERKRKGKELLKVLGMSALAIGLFVAAFIGINSLAFDVSTNNVESLPSVAESVAVPVAVVPPEDSAESESTVIVPEPYLSVNVRDAEISVIEQSLNLTVTVVEGLSVPSANAISPDDAALIGAQYIWHMFGEMVDGKYYVTLRYSAHPSQTRAYWVGTVTESALEPLDYDSSVEDRIRQIEAELFNFSIDAVTGEWIDIARRFVNEWSDEVGVALEQLFQDPDQEAIHDLRRDAPVPEVLDEYVLTAKEHASRHFAHTEVVSAQLRNVQVYNFGLDENGNVIAIAHQMVFEVTDSTGRIAEVFFDKATGKLFSINTQHNDFVPGFRFDDDGQGIG